MPPVYRAFYGARLGHQSGSVVLIPIADNLVRDLALALVPVVVAQRPIDQCYQKQKGSEEINGFHGMLQFSQERRTSDAGETRKNFESSCLNKSPRDGSSRSAGGQHE